MASDGGGKIKPKRSQHSNKPYDRRSSLLGKLTDSVKDLFVPSWLSWGSGDQSGVGESRETEGGSSQSVQDNPSRNSRSSSSTRTQSNSIGQEFPRPHGVETFSFREHVAPSGSSNYFTTAGGPAPNVTVRPQDSETPLRGNFVPSTSLQHQTAEVLPATPQPARPITVSMAAFNRSSSNSRAESEKKLWSPEYGRRGKPLVPPAKDKPAFNTSLLGNLTKNESFSFGDSSFYAGKTRYGGASAERQRPLNQSLPYQSSLPLRKQVRASKHNASYQATTSATAQRILETLDKMSTPLGDAKKIPKLDTSNDSILSFTPSSYRRTSLLGSSTRSATRPLQLISRGPPTSQYQAASQAVIAKNRHQPSRRDHSLAHASETSTGLKLSQEPVVRRDVSERVAPPPLMATTASIPATSSGMGKMKSKKFSQHISSTASASEVEIVEVPNLRTDFTLPVDRLTSIPLQQTNTQPSQKTSLNHTTSIPSSSLSTSASPLKFTFSTPIQEKRLPVSSHYSGNPDMDFRFSSPIQATVTKTSAAGAEEGSKSSPEPAVGASSIVGLGTSSAAAFSPLPVPAWGSTPTLPKPKKASSPDIGGTSSSFKSYTKWGSSKNSDTSAASVGAPAGMFSLAPAASLKSGSVMDILGKTSASFSTASSSGQPQVSSEDDLMAKFKRPAGSWECDTCMVVNKAEALRCVACEAAKPRSKPATAPLSSAATIPAPSGSDKPPPLSELFKKPAGSWECDMCMVQNQATAARCVACETPKPGGQKSSSTSSSGSSGVPLSELFKKPAGSWECDTCMVQNQATAARCVACEAPKPGGQKSNTTPSSGSSSVPLSALFKKPSGSWECDTCMVQNAATADRCIACESPRPGLQAAGIVSKPSVSSGTSMSVGPSGGFTFSIPASTSTTTTSTGGFQFGSSSSSTKPTVSASGGFKFDAPVGESSTASTGGFKFGAPPVSDSASSSGGFKFGAPVGESSTASTGGFKFGAPPVSDSNSSSGGFNFGAPVSDSSSGGFKLGGTSLTSDSAASTGGFKFGSSSTTNKSENCASISGAPATTGGFTFGSSAVAPAPAASEKGGFGFGSSNASQTAVPQAGGFVFGASKPSSDPAGTNLQPFPAPQKNLFGTSDSTPGAGFSDSQQMVKQTISVQPVLSTSLNGSVSSLQTVTTTTSSSSLPAPAGLFTFGSPVAGQNSSGLGMGQSLSAPMVNGGISSEKPSAVFGSSGPVFGQSATQNGPSQLGASSSNKRSVDFTEMGAPSAKKAFGAPSSAPNGPFSFGASSGASNSTAGPFGQSSSSGNGPVMGPTFGQPAALTVATAPAFNFSFTPQDTTMGNGPTKPPMSFNAAPNFNFGGTSQPASSTTPFQFGAKPAEVPSAPAPVATSGLFQFGGPPNAGAAAPSFPSVAPGTVGSFNMGASSTTTGRRIKKGVRRLKQ